MRYGGLGLALMLAGCGGQDRFAAGTWQVEAWMESAAGSTRGIAGANQSDTVRLSRDDAAMPPAKVVFGRFYHGMNSADVTFRDGRIEGSYEQSRVDDIAAHSVPISGTYGRDRFRLNLDFTVFGMTARQVVEGRLVTPA